MRIRFQADADLDGRVLRGLRRAAPRTNTPTSKLRFLSAADGNLSVSMLTVFSP